MNAEIFICEQDGLDSRGQKCRIRIQSTCVELGSHGGAEKDVQVSGFKIRRPASAAVTATIRQSPGQTANVPDLFAVKITDVSTDSVFVKVRRIDAGGGYAMPIALSLVVID